MGPVFVLKEWEKSELKKLEHLENTNLKKQGWTNPKLGCETGDSHLAVIS